VAAAPSGSNQATAARSAGWLRWLRAERRVVTLVLTGRGGWLKWSGWRWVPPRGPDGKSERESRGGCAVGSWLVIQFLMGKAPAYLAWLPSYKRDL